MPDPSGILVPLSVAERMAHLMESTEQHAAGAHDAAVAVGARLDKLEDRVAPALDDYAAHIQTMKDRENQTVADRARGRSAIERILTGRPAIALYTAAVVALAGLLTQRGCIPAVENGASAVEIRNAD